MTTVPKYISDAGQRVREMVVNMLPRLRRNITPEEESVAVYLRGNKNLYEGLTAMISGRLEGRANLPVPSDPIICRGMLERDHELRWLQSRIDYIYHSHPPQPGESDAEQPK